MVLRIILVVTFGFRRWCQCLLVSRQLQQVGLPIDLVCCDYHSQEEWVIVIIRRSYWLPWERVFGANTNRSSKMQSLRAFVMFAFLLFSSKRRIRSGPFDVGFPGIRNSGLASLFLGYIYKTWFNYWSGSFIHAMPTNSVSSCDLNGTLILMLDHSLDQCPIRR